MLQSEGIREAVIVTGHEGDRLRRELASEPSLVLTLKFVENRRYDAKNGVSLLAAREHIDGPCLLTMSDHLYSPQLVRRLLADPRPGEACSLAVDYDIERCFDLEDATKVRVSNHRIVDIHKGTRELSRAGHWRVPDWAGADRGTRPCRAAHRRLFSF